MGSLNEEEDKIDISLVGKIIGGHEVSFLKEDVLPSYSQGETIVDGNGSKNFKQTNYKRNRL